jgi:protein-tyrosine-phosphatase
LTESGCRILFVCTGNLCRSPMAEGILKKMLAEAGIQNIQVFSAGTIASGDYPVTRLTQQVASERGIDLSQHRSQYLSVQLVEKADLILVMERIHRKEIGEWFPNSRDKVYLLRSFGDGESGDIEDPIGGNQEVFELCYQLIESEINRIFPILIQRCREITGTNKPKMDQD